MDLPEQFRITLTRKPDQTFEFKPDPGTIEFANALNVNFPGNSSIESKMQRAIMRKIKEEEEEGRIKDEIWQDPSTNPSKARSSVSSGTTLNTLNPVPSFEPVQQTLTPPPTVKKSKGGNPKTTPFAMESMMSVITTNNAKVVKKGRKGPLTQAQRVRANANRLNKSVCKRHREERTRCDPETCPDNAIFTRLRSTSSASYQGGTSAGAIDGSSPMSIGSGYLRGSGTNSVAGGKSTSTSPNNFPPSFTSHYGLPPTSGSMFDNETGIATELRFDNPPPNFILGSANGMNFSSNSITNSLERVEELHLSSLPVSNDPNHRSSFNNSQPSLMIPHEPYMLDFTAMEPDYLLGMEIPTTDFSGTASDYYIHPENFDTPTVGPEMGAISDEHFRMMDEMPNGFTDSREFSKATTEKKKKVKASWGIRRRLRELVDKITTRKLWWKDRGQGTGEEIGKGRAEEIRKLTSKDPAPVKDSSTKPKATVKEEAKIEVPREANVPHKVQLNTVEENNTKGEVQNTSKTAKSNKPTVDNAGTAKEGLAKAKSEDPSNPEAGDDAKVEPIDKLEIVDAEASKPEEKSVAQPITREDMIVVKSENQTEDKTTTKAKEAIAKEEDPVENRADVEVKAKAEVLSEK
ncbi:hypothetical protein BJ875DRAFT_441289 [Amylocarpus encephaloides]|uniref:Uncharacterized protein n=1 Tax=Amylocarpus encephaloides TaxID=45428 RepID=A0A9P8C581_9HELO|nr:hypothetical protein BJ875DRAFT_441289 [Amylocarpus encephaloides]